MLPETMELEENQGIPGRLLLMMAFVSVLPSPTFE